MFRAEAAEPLHVRLTKNADIVLAVFVVSVVGMMIVPMPTWLLDILISTNISVAVILLLTAIYVPEPLKIATFPTLLLVTTLFRLALNVSSTRLILLQANAGEVIRAFGEFVVSGNMVVGAVVFLILTLIQFIVIAKGSERVAEVSARFTLDAMPGKQMSIDADLRSGLIDQEEARRRRQELERESQLYGSMDGAMKFVKGDAIAGILITIINITAGLVIGVTQMGMSWGEAAATYSILTIGDGLVSQIPALIISTSAGMIVTRVASETKAGNLGADIGRQILAQPKAIGIAGVLMGLLALIPGLPTIPFLILGTFCGVTAYGLMRSSGVPEEAGEVEEWEGPGLAALGPAAEPEEEERRSKPELLDVVRLEMGPELLDRIRPENGSNFVTELMPRVREAAFGRLGIIVPPARIVPGRGLEPLGYRILVKEVPEGAGVLRTDRLAVPGGIDELRGMGIEAEDWLTGPDGPVSLVSQEMETAVQTVGLPYWQGEALVAIHLEAVLHRKAALFMGIQQAKALLDALEQTHPDLVSELVPKRVSVEVLAEVLKRLVDEGVCVRNLPDILEALARWARTEKDPVLLTEYARMALGRQIGHVFSAKTGFLPAFLLDPLVEETVAEAVKHTDSGGYLALDPDMASDFLAAVAQSVEPSLRMGTRPVIVTRMEIRRYVRKLVEPRFPELAVLSFQELDPELDIRPVGRIGPSPEPEPGGVGPGGAGGIPSAVPGRASAGVSLPVSGS